MPQHIGYVTLVVREYDEAIAYFTQTLGFDLTEDSPSMDREGREKRWVLIAPPGSTCTKILLAKASSPGEAARIGDQTGGRVFTISAHRQFLARLQRHDRERSEVRQRTKGRGIRNGCGFR